MLAFVQIDPTADGRSEIGMVAGRVGDEVVAPAVKHAPMRIDPGEKRVHLKFAGARFKPVGRSVPVAQRAGHGFDLGAMKHPVAQVNAAKRVQRQRIGRVMRISRIQPHQHPLDPIRPPVTRNSILWTVFTLFNTRSEGTPQSYGTVRAREVTRDLCVPSLSKGKLSITKSLTGPDGLLKQLIKSVLETVLDEEMTEHLGYAKHDPAGAGSSNIRNGSRAKTVPPAARW
jgi:hypothetical protein